MKKTDTNILEELFTAQAHLGHKTNRVHPKAEKYIYKVENAVSIIDLTQTATLLEKAVNFLKEQAKEGKVLMVVSTKKVAAPIVNEYSKKHGIAFVTSKWPPGLLTNFQSLQHNIKKMLSMREARDNGEWEQLIKFEQSQLRKELSKLERVYGGLAAITKMPDILFIIDLKKEKNALIEAEKMAIPVVAITDTNVNPNVAYPIPANDDAASSVEYIVQKVLEAYSQGK